MALVDDLAAWADIKDRGRGPDPTMGERLAIEALKELNVYGTHLHGCPALRGQACAEWCGLSTLRAQIFGETSDGE